MIDAKYTGDIAKQHANYSKLENYSNLFNVYKDRYCIPLGIGYRAETLNNEVLNYYEISTEKSVITYEEYLQIKQKMKAKGAKFEFNRIEYRELIDYYLIKNNLKFIDSNNLQLEDKNKLTTALEDTIYSICNELEENNNTKLNTEKSSLNIYDENSKLILCDENIMPCSITGYSDLVNLGNSILNTTLAIFPDNTFLSPSFYMYKKSQTIKSMM